MQIDIQRVGEGVLCTFEGGAAVHFESRHDAQLFGQNLMMVAALGADMLDEPLHELVGTRCSCGSWEATLGESIHRAFDKHLLEVRS